jgi:hypothetical protein
MRKLRFVTLLVAGGALLVSPVAVQAHHKPGHNHGPSNTSKRCKHTPRVGFVVRGTLTAVTADNPQTEAFEGSVTITVTGANRHARHSGELQDQDANKAGVQVKGGTYTVDGDAYRLKLVDYEANETPGVGDAVRISGLIPWTKKRCAPEGTSLADRYGEPNVRKVTIKDADQD